MAEFFRGWKRKVGMLTLLLACVFMAGWLRSPIVSDVLNIPTGKHSFIGLASSGGSLGWARCHFRNPAKSNMSAHPFWEKDKYTHSLINLTLFDIDGLKWRWRCFGFGFYEGSIDDGDNGYWMNCLQIPYWSIVVSLTLLSSHLLLSKPRKSTQKKSTDPTANVGA